MENYEVLKPIGKGKFAIVYRAQRKGDDELVALKKISIDMMDERAREKCLKEVRLLQSLDHPNIIRYLDSFLDGNELVIVVEWAAAGDLKRQLRKAQEKQVLFEERVIWKYFSQICEALKHMHDRRILHRDLKPANIFLTTNGVVKVGDLGLGRSMGEHSMEAHSKVGTPLYMSPEVLRGDGYDWKSDIWSLGCLLYELAMLKSPFKAEGLNLYSLFQKISHGDYLPLPDHYSRELRELAYTMISTDASHRPDIHTTCQIAQQMRARTSRNGSLTSLHQLPAANQGIKGRPPQGVDRPLEPQDMGSGTQQPERKGPQAEGKSPTGLQGEGMAGDRIKTAQWTQRVDGGTRRSPGTYLQEVEAKAAILKSGQLQKPAKPARLPQTAQATPEGDEQEQQRAEQRRQQQQQQQPPPASPATSADPSTAPLPQRDHASVSRKPKQSASSPPTTTQSSPPHHPHDAGQDGATPSAESAVASAQRPSSRRSSARASTAASPSSSLPSPHTQRATTESAGEALHLMESVWETITILASCHEPRGALGPPRISRLHFSMAGPTQGRAKISKHQQFTDLTELITWLLQEGDLPPVATPLTELEAPIVTATTLLNAVRAAGFEDVTGRLTSMELTKAWGVSVCQMLHWLAHKALKRRGGDAEKPTVYCKDGNQASTDVVDEEVILEDDSQVRDLTSVAPSQGEGEDDAWELCIIEPRQDEAIPASGQEQEESITVDPVRWREEVERVGAKLSAGARNMAETADWAGHLASMHRYHEQFWPDERGRPGRLGPVPPPCQSLRTLSTVLEEEVDGLTTKERLLQTQEDLRRAVAEYRTVKQELGSLQEEVQARTACVVEKAKTLEDLTFAVTEVKERVEDASASASGVGSLLKMRQALAKLTAEVKEMTMREGMLEAQLWQARAKSGRFLALLSHRADTADSGTDIMSDVNLVGGSVADDFSDFLDWTELSRPRTDASNSTVERGSVISSSFGTTLGEEADRAPASRAAGFRRPKE